MKLLLLLPLTAFLLIITLRSGGQKKVTRASDYVTSNPFYKKSSLPYQAPPFDKIKDADFKPALEEGMKLHLKEIEEIAGNPQSATFENTLVAIEKSGSMLDRVNSVFSLLTGANTNPELQKIQEAIAPKQAAHRDAIYLKSKLFKRIEKIYNNRGKLKLDAESNRLIEVYYQRFVLSGAKLSDADKATLKKMNEEEASLSAKFINQLLAAAKAGALIVNDSSKLAGLSHGELDAAARDAKANKQDNKWLIALQNTTQQPSLQSLSNRATR
jgi:peptidyl-dipeptidase Dcp